MPALLVSVRSADEARAAWEAGADVIDVKEPGRGPLGPADPGIWAEIRAALPPGATVSAALGEISEWRGMPDPSPLVGLAYGKLGLAGAGTGWRDALAGIRKTLDVGPSWVAVAYADWEQAGSPAPGDVLDEAIRSDCAGLLIDTWDKSRPSPVEAGEPWSGWIRAAQDRGLFVALAGGLDAPDLGRLGPLCPDLFAVRGAACARGERLGRIDPARVARLSGIVRALDSPRTGRPSTLSRTSRS